MASFSSGVPQLDRVLGGGIPVGDMILVMGAAGSGKTTLALQTAFSTAASGSTVCFVSTTSESPHRLLEHARSYDFYDETVVGERLILLSVFPLIQEGLDPVREALEREVQQHEAKLLVLDGLMTLYDLHGNDRELRIFLHQTAEALSARGCTLFITSSRSDIGDTKTAAELTMADALIRLTQTVTSTRSDRHIQVVKIRGRTPLLGLHSVRLDGSGVAVFPRFESLARTAESALPVERIASGFPELDSMMGGGFLAGSFTALAGAVGTGKTLLALQFLLEGARNGQQGMWLSLKETKTEMLAKARSFGLELETHLEEGGIVFIHRSPVDLQVDEVVHELEEALEDQGFERFVLDGVDELTEPVAEELRRNALVHVLSGMLRHRGITAVVPVPVAKVVGPELDLEHTPMAVLAQNLILLRYVEYGGELYRILSILKARESEFDASIRRYTIGANGMQLFERSEATDALLTGITRLASEARVKRGKKPGDE